MVEDHAGWAPTLGQERCDFEDEIDGTTWCCVKWKHEGPHYLRPQTGGQRD
jgi:hypothetical protein